MRKGSHLTDEQKKAVSDSKKGSVPWNKGLKGVQVSANKGKPMSDVQKKKLSDSAIKRCSSPDFHAYNLGKPMSDEQKKLISEHRKGKTAGEKNPMYGKKHTPEELALMSKNRKGKCTGKDCSLYGKVTHAKGQWFELPDGGRIWLRSSYEVRVVTALLQTDIDWEYELTFPIELDGKQMTYHPDFYFPEEDLFWEVKGYWYELGKRKFIRFTEQYPDKKIKVVEEDDIKQLEELLLINNTLDVKQFGHKFNCT